MPMRVAPLSSMLARCGGESRQPGEGLRQRVIAGADVLRRGPGPVALLEPLVEGAQHVVVELVAAGHGLGLGLGHLHQCGIDGDRRKPVIGPVAGDHRSRGRGVDLRVRRRHAAIEARLAGRQFALARAGAQQRQCRSCDETARRCARAAHGKSCCSPLPLHRPACGNSMAEAWKRSCPAFVNSWCSRAPAKPPRRQGCAPGVRARGPVRTRSPPAITATGPTTA